MSAARTPPTLLPELQRELLRAAHAQRHRRLVNLRSAAAAALIAVLLGAPSSAALGVSHQSAPPVLNGDG
ncbi:MAG TPA: hypothetical protein VGF15_06335 [Solirubrobacteraceae bacterium]|jgi:hypothetical protein